MTMLVVDLDEMLLEKFRKFAVNKHGRIYGVLKPEVELALRNHLTAQECGQRRQPHRSGVKA